MLTQIIKRCRQLYIALSAKMTREDRSLVVAYLDADEEKLFYGMDEKVQKHCVNVALTLMNHPALVHHSEKDILIKSALLHDIGKIKNTFTLLDRVLYVLGNKLTPGLTAMMADKQTNKIMFRFRKAIYYNLHHPAIGAELAEAHGVDERIIFLIKNHHNKGLICSNPDLKLLAEADEQN